MEVRTATELRLVASEPTAETGHSPLVGWEAVERTRTLDFFRRGSGETRGPALLERIPGILA
jgi:hypothetical protein